MQQTCTLFRATKKRMKSLWRNEYRQAVLYKSKQIVRCAHCISLRRCYGCNANDILLCFAGCILPGYVFASHLRRVGMQTTHCISHYTTPRRLSVRRIPHSVQYLYICIMSYMTTHKYDVIHVLGSPRHVVIVAKWLDYKKNIS